MRTTPSAVVAARVIDRLGKGIRDAPRDAFMADLTAKEIRGEGFGLRLALAIAGFVVGPLIAIALMKLSGDDFRLVFWIALIPAYLSIIVLLVAVKELPSNHDGNLPRLPIRRGDIHGPAGSILVGDLNRRPLVPGALQSGIPRTQGPVTSA